MKWKEVQTQTQCYSKPHWTIHLKMDILRILNYGILSYMTLQSKLLLVPYVDTVHILFNKGFV